MEHYLILARSITYAQRMQRAMSAAGVRCQMFRAPRDLAESGCAYVLKVEISELNRALSAIYRSGLGIVRVFEYQNGTYREVGI